MDHQRLRFLKFVQSRSVRDVGIVSRRVEPLDSSQGRIPLYESSDDPRAPGHQVMLTKISQKTIRTLQLTEIRFMFLQIVQKLKMLRQFLLE